MTPSERLDAKIDLWIAVAKCKLAKRTQNWVYTEIDKMFHDPRPLVIGPDGWVRIRRDLL